MTAKLDAKADSKLSPPVEPNPKVDAYLARQKRWGDEQTRLREILLSCGMGEELKWGVPCYTWQGKNVVLIHAFKAYCAILFHKGVLLKDPEGILVIQTENVQSARQVRFTSLQEIIDQESVLRAYVREAIDVETAGLKVEFKKTAEFNMPEEFQAKLDEIPPLQEAFMKLTPGRQRGYLLHFAAPKQSATRVARIEKCMPRIFDGLGLND